MAQVYISQYARRAGVADSVEGTASYATIAAQVNPIRLDPIQDPNPTGLLYPSSTYLYQSASNTSLGYDLYFRQDGNLVKWKWVEGMLNTGLLYGGVLSYSASSFLITPGSGLIINHNAVTGSEIGPMIEYVTWGPITQSIENIATYQNTFVYIDVSGSASQQNVFFSPEQYQNYIPIGRVSHYNNVNANNSYENVQTVYDIDGQQNIFVRAFGPLKLKGIATSGQAGTLRLNISSGTAFNLGGYYPYNPETPSTYNMSTYNTASIIRIYRSGSGYKFDDNGGSYYTTIDPGKYDDGTGVLATVNNNDWSIQRVMVNPVTGRAHVYYGQSFYDTFDDAVGAIFSDPFVESDATAFTYPFSAYLIVKGDTTDLTNTAQNEIVQAGLFRNVAGGGGTGGGGIPGGSNTQIQFNNEGVFDGEPEFTFDPLTNIVTLTGSMFVSGTISASYGTDTVGFYGTSSWAVSASRAISASRAVTASFAISSSRTVTASLALTASFAITSSYASSSPNFANTNLVFTDNRKHSTNNYSYFIYSDIVGGNPDNPFDGIGVSGSFYFFNSSSNALGTAAGSTNTYTYIEITTQSIDLSFNADPIVPSSYTFTKNSASFSSSLTVTKSVYFPGLTQVSQPNVVMIDTASGQLYYTASSAIGGGGTANIAISSSGNGLTATVASINFTGTGVTAATVSNDVTVTIPGGAGVAGGANTQIQFNSGSSFSGSGNFSFDYDNSIVYLTGSSLTSGSIRLTGSMFVSGAISASFGPNTVGFFGTASWAQSASQAVSSSYSLSSSYALSASNALSSSYSLSSSYALSASYALSSSYSLSSSYALSASYALSSSYSLSSSYALSASYALSSSYALSASYALSSSYALSASYSNTSSYSFTSSLAFTASFITASNVWGPFGSSSILSASYASGSTSASYAGTASVILNPYPINVTGSSLYSVSPVAGIPSDVVASNNIYLGSNAGLSATGIYNSNFLGSDAGRNTTNAYQSNFLGTSAGRSSFSAFSSNFLGPNAGRNADSASNSNFLGEQAGQLAVLASNSNFLGFDAGKQAVSASYSTFIGFRVGTALVPELSVGSNNIIIGTNITLEANRKNSINIGGIIFGSGSYSNTSSGGNTPSSGSAGGNIGINVPTPTYNLHVSGTICFPNLTDSNTATKVVLLDNNGQLFTTASSAIGGGGSGTPTPPGGLDTQIQFNSGSKFSGNGNFTFNYVTNAIQLTGSSLITGSLIVTGSTSVLGTSSINGIALIGTSSAQALYTTARITTIAGLNTIYSLPTASYDGAFFDYTLISGTNARAGQIMSIWSGSQVRYTETTTTDIGSTSEFIFSVALTAGSASLQVTGSTGAVIKTIIKGI